MAIVFMNSSGDTSRVTIENVLYVPSIGGNLISVKRLTEKGFKVGFSGGTCDIRTGNGKSQIAVGDIVGNLYQMRIANENAVVNCQKLCIHKWHRVLGHRDIDVVKKIPSNGFVTEMALAGCDSGCNEGSCEICM